MLVNLLVKILGQEQVLKELKQLQQLDQVDIEGVYYLQQKQNNVQSSGKSPFCTNRFAETFADLDKYSEELVKKKINDYLTSMTAKDCSIMLSLFPLKTNQPMDAFMGFPVVSLGEDSYFQYCYRISVIDLGPKLTENITTYYHLDQTIADHFLNLKKVKLCTDLPL